MSSWMRALLWILVVVVPGGMLLLPILVNDLVRSRRAKELQGGNHQLAESTTTP